MCKYPPCFPKLLLFVCLQSHCVTSASSSLCSFLFDLFLCVPPFTPKSFSLLCFPAAMGQAPLSIVWSLALLLWLLVGGAFPEGPGLP